MLVVVLAFFHVSTFQLLSLLMHANVAYKIVPLFFRVILEHAKGIERGSGGGPLRERSGYGASFSNSVSGRKQRAREK